MPSAKRSFAPPQEVTGYFDGKTNRPAFSWLDVWAEEHAYRFTVAKATELDLLNAFRRTISQALSDGQGIDSWRPLIQAELTKLGWWGPRLVMDPTGQDDPVRVDFSNPRRLKTIFWSNVNSARSAGQWERAQRSKKFLPYALYVATTSSDPRPEHRALVGTILPVDHPFWRSYWPPNGWGCKCQVRMISAREAERLIGTTRIVGSKLDGSDITIEYRDTAPDLGPPVDVINRRTGERSSIPAGIDPGWHTNPGLARASTLIANLEAQLAEAAPVDANRVLTELWADPYLRLAPLLPEKVWLPAGHNPALAAELGAVSPVISIPTNVITDRIRVHSMAITDFALLPEMLRAGIILPDMAGSAKTRTVLYRLGRTIWRAFVVASSNGYLRVNSMHQQDHKRLRQKLKDMGIDWPLGD
ncbi:phage head morphogenesis protein [Pannonibacter sp. SL95]|uniref:phage head morphogenesis protein n=1 Tax=Pannonibacter sp. SL95 TaxID=2995153 RepID=UPI002274BCD6|nr:phage minor head protein [Pannonibacter sp. SL95]MCY1705231.1 phage minor head protein [Pannonibacter sp. SL95]